MRPETKRRARALQMLCAMELGNHARLEDAAVGVARLTGPEPGVYDEAVDEALQVRRDLPELDRIAQRAAENWRLERVAVVERNILRLGIHELREGVTPPRVVLDEAGLDQVVGTICGDDTIFIACATTAAASNLTDELRAASA